MPKYSVTVPFTGYAVVDVEAPTEAEAIDKALGEVSLDDIEEWETHEQITEGNVCHAARNRAEAELINEDD